MLLIFLGSQAVSSTNLTSDDTLSIRSMSVDDTPDFESRYSHSHSNNEQHYLKSRGSSFGLKNEIADLKNDVNMMKNERNLKSDLNDSFSSNVAKKTPVTPGVRVNPFLKDFEDEGLSDSKSFSTTNIQESESKKKSESNASGNEQKSKTWVDPLGCLPVQSQVNASLSKTVSGSTTNDHSNLSNGQIMNDEEDAVASDQSNPDTQSEVKSNDVSSVGSAGDYDSPYEGTSVVKTQLPPGKVLFKTYWLTIKPKTPIIF